MRRAADPRRDLWPDSPDWVPLRHIGEISYGIYVYHFFLSELFIKYSPQLEPAGSQQGWRAFSC